MMAMAFMALTITVGSCSKNDEPPGGGTEIPDQPGEYEVGWSEDGNTVVFTIAQNVYYYSYTATYTCQFNNDGYCTSAIVRYEFSDSQWADAFYADQVQYYDGNSITKNGKVVTIDETEDFYG